MFAMKAPTYSVHCYLNINQFPSWLCVIVSVKNNRLHKNNAYQKLIVDILINTIKML